MRSAEKAKERLMKDKETMGRLEVLALQEGKREKSFEAIAAERDVLTFRDANDKTQEDVQIENLEALIRGYKGQIEYLDGEDNSLKIELRSMKKEVSRWRREAGNLKKYIANLEVAVRELMDETELDGESKKSRALRQFVWNQADNEAQKATQALNNDI